jgi:Ser/Thr protein kinase RdoA (MazF antagonist)
MLLKQIINKFIEGNPELLKTTAGENSKIVIFKIKKDKYILRIKKYNKYRTHPKKEFEFLEKVKQKKLPTKTPIIIKTKNNKPYFYNKEYYTIFKYIDGNNKYLWNNSNFNKSEIKKIFKVLAKFHNLFSKIEINKTWPEIYSQYGDYYIVCWK